MKYPAPKSIRRSYNNKRIQKIYFYYSITIYYYISDYHISHCNSSDSYFMGMCYTIFQICFGIRSGEILRSLFYGMVQYCVYGCLLSSLFDLCRLICKTGIKRNPQGIMRDFCYIWKLLFVSYEIDTQITYINVYCTYFFRQALLRVFPFLVLWVAANYSYSYALGHISASAASSIMSSNTAMVCILSYFVLHAIPSVLNVSKYFQFRFKYFCKSFCCVVRN